MDENKKEEETKVSPVTAFEFPKIKSREYDESTNIETLTYDNGMVQKVIGFKNPLA